MQEMDVTPDDIRTVDDVVKLPFTTKQDLRDNYPYGLFAVPMSQIVRLHASSGDGLSTVLRLYPPRLAIWSEMIARCLSAFRDRLQRHLFGGVRLRSVTGGLGLHYGVEHLGATVIPMSSGNTAKHIKLIRFRSDRYHLHSLIRPLPGRSDGPGPGFPGRSSA